MRYLLAIAFVAACSHAHDTAPAGNGSGITTAQDAQVTSTAGTQVALADAWKGHAHGVVVFYRGFY